MRLSPRQPASQFERLRARRKGLLAKLTAARRQVIASRAEGTDRLMARRRNSRPFAPRPSVPDPRPHLLDAVLAFVRAARSTPGVLRIALLGSLATDQPVPKNADVLVAIDPAIDLGPLARLGRRLQGTAQTVNLEADVFLADAAGRYTGRVCHYRECRPGVACRALSCGLRQRLNDDLQIRHPDARRRSADRAVAPQPRELCRAGGHAGASCSRAGRRASQDLSRSERRV
jgi:hypothetical protein